MSILGDCLRKYHPYNDSLRNSMYVKVPWHMYTFSKTLYAFIPSPPINVGLVCGPQTILLLITNIDLWGGRTRKQFGNN